MKRDSYDQFKLKVCLKEKLLHNVVKLRLEFPNPDWITGLWAGGHFILQGQVNNMPVVRKYTPTSSVDTKGYVEFHIKIYKEEPVEGVKKGIFTEWLDQHVHEGDMMLCQAPRGHLKYYGFGFFKLKEQSFKRLKKIYMLAGGTGLTPLFSMIQASTMVDDKVQMEIIISNRTKKDIFLKPELDNFVLFNKNLKVHHTLTRHNEKNHGKR